MSYKVNFLAGWTGRVLSGFSNGLDKISADIVRRSQMNAPVLTGALRESHHVVRTDNFTREIVAGDGDVPYARRRHYENFSNPQTLKYLERAGEDIGQDARSNPSKYFKVEENL